MGAGRTSITRQPCKRFGAERLIAAVDAREGQVVIDGWRTRLDITPVDAIRALEPFFGEFLFTNVDVEGLMQGINRKPSRPSVTRPTVTSPPPAA